MPRTTKSRIDQRVVFHPDRRRTTGLGMGDFLLDVLTDALSQVDR
jgi:hypothetical protein